MPAALAALLPQVAGFAVTTGLTAAGTAAAEEGIGLLARSGGLGSVVKDAKIKIYGEKKVGNPYWSENTKAFVVDETDPKGVRSTKPVGPENVQFTRWGNMGAYQTDLLAEQKRRTTKELTTDLRELREGDANRAATNAIKVQAPQLQNNVDMVEATGRNTLQQQVVRGETDKYIADRGGKSNDYATETTKVLGLANLTFQEKQMEALTKQAERKQALDERIQAGNERNTSYDQQMNSWRANAEIEAAQHAWRKNLPSGLATAAQGLALLMG